MKHILTRFVLVLLLLLCMPFTQSQAAVGEKGELVAALVRNMGYGGGIHHFKDYVLRGHRKYRVSADAAFAEAAEVLARLRSNVRLTPRELDALDDIAAVIAAYRSKLPVIQGLYEKEKSLARILGQVDEEVKIDDTAAIEGIDLLRSTSGPFTPLEEIEHALGYGGGIHNFKNFLIRQADKYREGADTWFTTAFEQTARLRTGSPLAEKERAALRTLKQTIDTYRKSLPRVEKTLARARGSSNETIVNIAVRGADKSVKIDDASALDALAVLRGD